MFSSVYHRLQYGLTQFSRILPSSCALCGMNGNEEICTGCQQQFFGRAMHRCVQCAVPIPFAGGNANIRCGHCLHKSPAFDATIAAVDYTPPLDQLVLGLKFGSKLALTSLLARQIRDATLQVLDRNLPSQLMPVPLGPQRLAERGFNQALEIAKPLSRALGIRLIPNLAIRVRDTRPQSLLPPDERQRNIRHAFLVGGDYLEMVKGQHIGIVDDVMTTGETLNELAATLKRFGAARITNFVFARTLPK